jgi:hypothetical protein
MNTATLPLKTPEAARRLGVPYHRLFGLLRDGKLGPPQKDSSGEYVWGPEDVERARLALRARRGRRAEE